MKVAVADMQDEPDWHTVFVVALGLDRNPGCHRGRCRQVGIDDQHDAGATAAAFFRNMRRVELRSQLDSIRERLIEQDMQDSLLSWTTCSCPVNPIVRDR